MALFEKMKDSISVAGQGVSQKAKSATESVKLNNQIKSNERMLEKLTYQVGVQCVKNHLQDAESEYGELFGEILRLQKENQQLQQMVQALTALSLRRWITWRRLRSISPRFGNSTTAMSNTPMDRLRMNESL